MKTNVSIRGSRQSRRSAPDTVRESKHSWLLRAIIALIVVAAYIPALRSGYIWDDDVYVTHNPTLRTVEGLWVSWAHLSANVQYYPLVFTSFWLEYHVWQLSPFGYHLVNVVLHLLNALLVWHILRRLEISGAWLAAAVFAIHPVHRASRRSDSCQAQGNQSAESRRRSQVGGTLVR